MRKLFTLAMMVTALAFVGCSDDDETSGRALKITNATSYNWYNAQVWFRDTEEGDLKGYEEIGNVMIGESVVVNAQGEMFYIYAKDHRGNLLMTKNRYIGSGDKKMLDIDWLTR